MEFGRLCQHNPAIQGVPGNDVGDQRGAHKQQRHGKERPVEHQEEVGVFSPLAIREDICQTT